MCLQRGSSKESRLPPWTVVLSGLLLAVALVSYGEELHPRLQHLKWVALGAVAVGIPPILIKVSLRERKGRTVCSTADSPANSTKRIVAGVPSKKVSAAESAAAHTGTHTGRLPGGIGCCSDSDQGD